MGHPNTDVKRTTAVKSQEYLIRINAELALGITTVTTMHFNLLKVLTSNWKSLMKHLTSKRGTS